MKPDTGNLYGLLAEFEQPEDLVAAAHHAHREGYRRMDAFTPFPVHGLAEAVGFRKTRLPLLVLIGGILGGGGGFLLQWYASVVDYPWNIGGRPLNSWPSFIIITFELTVLVAGLTAVLGMLGLNGLPRPHHPLFNVPRFDLASHNRFFLCIEAIDPLFDRHKTRSFLHGLKPLTIHEVPVLTPPKE